VPALVIGAVVLVAVVAVGFSLGSGSPADTAASPATSSEQVPDDVVSSSATPSPSPSEVDTPTDDFTSPSTEQVQPTDEASAQTALGNEIAADQSAAEQLLDQWVPQLSSKKPGLVVDGVDYDYVRIWQNFEQLRAQYPSALLVWSGNYTSFKSADFYVTVAAQPYSDSGDANQWCDDANIDVNDCYAKLLSHSAGPAAATVLRP
jgi:hypothetical protein